ncbi:MAG: DNA-binding protein YbiB [Moraxellaceae bacterium]|nr:DNA-binding protein YbiB [Moraxellaceae bacterium]
MNYAAIIKEIGRGAKGAKDMSREQAQAVFAAILTGEVPDMELGAMLLSLRIKGESGDELAGFKMAMDAATAHVDVPAGPRCVLLPTYNGGRKQANLMPVVALLLARAGIPVLIQGRHDFDSRVSPFELLDALDIQRAASIQEAEAQLAARHLAVLPLHVLNPGLDRLLALRPRLGVRNSGHTLAKMLDPCPRRSVRVIAVTHPPYLVTMEQYLRDEDGHALLMRGTEGEAYAHPRRRPRMLVVEHGVTRVACEQGESDADEMPDADCSVPANTAIVRAMLAGEAPVPTPILEQVALLKALATGD